MRSLTDDEAHLTAQAVVDVQRLLLVVLRVVLRLRLHHTLLG